jgi:hypothetical protein
MFELLVDFNEIQDDVVAGLIEDASGPLNIGDQVLLHDDGEHECRGTVDRIEGGLVYLRIDWSSWASTRERVAHELWWYSLGTNLAGASAPAPQFGSYVRRVADDSDEYAGAADLTPVNT